MTVWFIDLYTKPNDYRILQDDQKKFSAWAEESKMTFNICKCCIMQLSKHHQKKWHSIFNAVRAISQDSWTALISIGVIIDHRLLWKPHVNYAWGKRRNKLDFFSKTLKYKQFVLPILDYALSVWDPYRQCGVNKLEMVQHRVTGFVLAMDQGTHTGSARMHSISYKLAINNKLKNWHNRLIWSF